MKNLNFVAIDLETATSVRSSICEIGICTVEDGRISNTQSWLVQPENNEYDGFNIYIHGITPKMTRESPSFPDVWKEVEPYLTDKVVVAHNAAFDMYALRDAFDEYNMPYPHFIFYCSYRLSSYILNAPCGYSLRSLCDFFDITRENEHRAADDAQACALVFMKCLEETKLDEMPLLAQKYAFKEGEFSANYFRPQRSTYSKVKSRNIEADVSKIDEDSIFYGKNVCITGTLKFCLRVDALQIIADIGGTPCDSVTKKTDILIIGQQDYKKVGENGMSSKHKKALDLIHKGQKIDILSEEDFLGNITFDKHFIKMSY